MKTFAALALMLTLAAPLAACADGPAAEGDVATYDVLKAARTDCAAKGGELTLTKDGLATRLSAYECIRKPAQ
jgi:uncharacterized membrane protein